MNNASAISCGVALAGNPAMARASWMLGQKMSVNGKTGATISAHRPRASQTQLLRLLEQISGRRTIRAVHARQCKRSGNMQDFRPSSLQNRQRNVRRHEVRIRTNRVNKTAFALAIDNHQRRRSFRTHITNQQARVRTVTLRLVDQEITETIETDKPVLAALPPEYNPIESTNSSLPGSGFFSTGRATQSATTMPTLTTSSALASVTSGFLALGFGMVAVALKVWPPLRWRARQASLLRFQYSSLMVLPVFCDSRAAVNSL
jgi:hypothetical protein